MPPPLPASDDESSERDVPSSKAKENARAENGDTEMKDAVENEKPTALAKGSGNGDVEDDEEGKEEEDEEEEGDADDEEVYIVEKILEHRADFDDGGMRYLIKWKGYEKKSDMTWETEENLAGARDILQEYWTQIGGRPLGKKEKAAQKRRSAAKLKRESKVDSDTPPPKKQKRGRKSAALDDDDDDGPKGLINAGDDEWTVPHPYPGAWDHQIQSIDTVERDENGQLWAYIVWSEKTEEGRYRRSKAKMQAVYKAAPQKMLQFYENHLKFPDVEKPLA